MILRLTKPRYLQIDLFRRNNVSMPQLKLQDATIHYELSGEGPPVLLIQGVGVTGSGWRPQVQGLCSQFTCLTFDNRGIGQSSSSTTITIESMAADALALMDEVGWESAHVVGHSMGGLIAQQLAIASPRRVRSLSLLCTFSRGREAARITPWVLWMSLRTRLGTRSMRRRAFLEMIWTRQALDHCNTDELAAQLAPILGRDLADQPSILLKQVTAMARHDLLHRLGELKSIPTLVLSASDDPIAQPKFGRALSEAIPGATFVVLEKTSHAVTIEHAEIVNQRLASFIQSIAAPQQA